MLERFELLVPLQRDSDSTPRYLEIPATVLAAWELERATEVEVDVNGTPAGRRRIRRRDADRWYIQLPEAACRDLGVKVGQRLRVSVRLASQDLPDELFRLLVNTVARERWDALSAADQRKIVGCVRDGQLPRTRWERGAKALGVEEPAPDDLVAASKDRGKTPLRVEAHFAPDNEESRKALSDGIDLLARMLAKDILYESWKEAVREDGGDPATAVVPTGLLSQWTAEFRPDLVREGGSKRPTKRG
jgi:hypothetical protein